MVCMVMYIVTAILLILFILNYALGKVLYYEPSNLGYSSNVRNYNIINNKNIMASPKYVIVLSALLGIFLGVYCKLGQVLETNGFVIWGMVLLLLIAYLIEITRKITITDENLELEKMFCTTKKIPLNTIDGIYIYSYNKKFLNKRALTTKLVVCTGNEKYKFTISSLDVKAVLYMMKDNFGITENKIFIKNK